MCDQVCIYEFCVCVCVLAYIELACTKFFESQSNDDFQQKKIADTNRSVPAEYEGHFANSVRRWNIPRIKSRIWFEIISNVSNREDYADLARYF